jgi:CRP-like cAMP-binding protein
VPIFSLLTNKQKLVLLHSVVREYYRPGTLLFGKSDAPVCLYIIESGEVTISFSGCSKKDIVLGSSEYFGETVFNHSGRQGTTATVTQNLSCLTVN